MKPIKIILPIMVAGFWLFTSAFSGCSNQNGVIEPSSHHASMDVPLGEDVVEPEKVEKTKTSLSPEKYKAWIEAPENGLVKVKTLGDNFYAVQYRPTDYMLLQQQALNEGQSLEDARKVYDELQYYTLRIGLSGMTGDIMQYGIEDYEQLDQRVQYLSFHLDNDIQLIDGKDTLDCAFHHYQPNYGLSPFIDIQLAFTKSQGSATNTKTLVYDDKVYGAGPVKLMIKETDLLKTPGLKM